MRFPGFTLIALAAVLWVAIFWLGCSYINP